jgi:hypothetical protein
MRHAPSLIFLELAANIGEPVIERKNLDGY